MTALGSQASGRPHTGGRNRFLIIVRSGDDSLHPCWLDPRGGRRNWDLHISRYGLGPDAPRPEDLPPGVFWTAHGSGTKWPGIAEAVERAARHGLWSVEDYDYIAIADDDLVVDAETWSRAFETAQRRNLPACQLGLLHGSFFGEPDTLRLPGLELHYVSRVELMSGVIRRDIFLRLLPYLPLEGNNWAMDHVLAHVAAGAGALAVLDNACALHTRRFWSGAAYAGYADAGNSAMAEEAAFLKRHGIAWLPQQTIGRLSRAGARPGPAWWRDLAILPARLLRRYRNTVGVARLAALADGRVWLLRRFGGVRIGAVDRSRISPAHRGRAFGWLAGAAARSA